MRGAFLEREYAGTALHPIVSQRENISAQTAETGEDSKIRSEMAAAIRALAACIVEKLKSHRRCRWLRVLTKLCCGMKDQLGTPSSVAGEGWGEGRCIDEVPCVGMPPPALSPAPLPQAAEGSKPAEFDKLRA